MRLKDFSVNLGGRSAFRGLALTAGLLLTVLAARPAEAVRGCLADPLLTGRTCSEVECVALQAAVTLACKSPAPTSCNSIAGCNALRREKGRWLDCAISRDTINARCWAGGDMGHQIASAQAWQNVGNCEARIALPEPVGCADPCPQIPGKSAPAAAAGPADAKGAQAPRSGEEDPAAATLREALQQVIQRDLKSDYCPAEGKANSATDVPGNAGGANVNESGQT